jgi:hypothetical protein
VDIPSPNVLIPVAGGAVVLLGIVIAVVRGQMAKRNRAMVERWARGAYALWTGGEDCGTWAMPRAQDALRSWYGAGNAQAFWEVVRGLRQGQTGNPAWDNVRAIDLLRIGTAATYIDADKCWAEAAAIGTELQRRYRSWEELAQAFEAGMHAWHRSRGVTDAQQLGRVQQNLPALRQTIWPGVRFDATLAVEED